MTGRHVSGAFVGRDKVSEGQHGIARAAYTAWSIVTVVTCPQILVPLNNLVVELDANTGTMLRVMQVWAKRALGALHWQVRIPS